MEIPRRRFISDLGSGLGGIALAALLEREARANPSPAALPLPAKAKSVIWLFMIGGTSHMESFDPKPALNQYAGKTIAETPYKATLDSPYLKKNLREFVVGLHKVHPKILPLQVGFRPRGQSGTLVSDWWPHVGARVDDIAFVRSMWTTDNNHGAQMQFHTGRHLLDGVFPTIGSWVHYGLGSLSDNLPQFIVLGKPLADCCGGIAGHGGDYLGPEHDGVPLQVDPRNPLPYITPGPDVSASEQAAEFHLLRRLHRITSQRFPDDPALRARVRSYEMAFQMQTAIPEVLAVDSEPERIRRLYGMDQEITREFGRQCLAARRLVERGVRFVQIFHGSNGGAGDWDAHAGLRAGHARLCHQVDQPIGALLLDLKQRGLLDETLVVWATEFGRTPGAQGSDGRDHHPYGFTVWLAGGGVRGGTVHGATDELGFHACADRHYVTDIHATVLRQLGLDHRTLEIPGRKRLAVDFGEPILPILA